MSARPASLRRRIFNLNTELKEGGRRCDRLSSDDNHSAEWLLLAQHLGSRRRRWRVYDALAGNLDCHLPGTNEQITQSEVQGAYLALDALLPAISSLPARSAPAAGVHRLSLDLNTGQVCATYQQVQKPDSNIECRFGIPCNQAFGPHCPGFDAALRLAIFTRINDAKRPARPVFDR